MKPLRLAGVFFVVASLAGSAAAADLAKIERKIAKEPSYNSKEVKYCLVVFGPEAAKRVWFVLDGKDLYIDRNGNGDLTERGEKITPTQSRTPFGNSEAYEVGKVPALGEDVTVEVSPDEEGWYLALTAKDLPWQRASPKASAKAADAPIVHFHGPLTLRSADEELNLADEPELYAQLGTQGLGEGTFAVIAYNHVPKDVHPVAEIEFPSGSSDAKPLRVEVNLNQRC